MKNNDFNFNKIRTYEKQWNQFHENQMKNSVWFIAVQEEDGMAEVKRRMTIGEDRRTI